jgi:hypothetical protein
MWQEMQHFRFQMLSPAIFAFSGIYYKCAELPSQNQWLIHGSLDAIPLGFMTLDNVSLNLIGAPSTSSTTNWTGEITGQISAVSTVGLNFIGSMVFNSMNGIEQLQITSSLSDEFVDIDFSLTYGDFACADDLLFFNVTDPTTYFGLTGVASIELKSILLTVVFSHFYFNFILFIFYTYFTF